METRVLTQLFVEQAMPKVIDGITNAVAKSFVDDRGPGRIILVTAAPRITQAEVKRRTDMCVKIIEALRGDLSWGIDRIIDHLPRYLRAELDGTPWEPDARRASWTTG